MQIWKLSGCLLLLSVSFWAQARKLHTRDFTRLSQVQVAEALRHSDVIFIPVGAVESNGIQPSGRDYVWPLAYASLLAEESGGLYLPGLMWSFPGTTRPAPSTIHLSPQSGVAFLKDLAHSLLRQGFRRQVYISASHGPAPLTLGTLVREFFEETGVPILYISMDAQWPRLEQSREDRRKALYGAFSLTNRIEDLPLQGDYAEPTEKLPENKGLAALGRLGYGGSLYVGSWIAGVMAHSSNEALPRDAAEREAWGREGVEVLRKQVAKMKIREAMEALAEHDRFTQQHIVPKFPRTLGPLR